MNGKLIFAALVAIGGVALVGARLARAETPRAVETPGAVDETRVDVPEPSDLALRYHRTGNVLFAVSATWILAVPAFFFLSGWSSRLRAWLERISGRRWLLVVSSFGVIYTVYAWLAELPLSYWAGYVRPHAYDLSTKTLAKWAGDSLKGLLVSCVLAALVTWLPYLLVRKSPRLWWLWGGLLAFPLSALLLVVTPVWIDPLFNDFGSMKDKALESRILALADRAGIEESRVFEVEKSVDTKTVNAYVTGFMGTRRIVLWDTIIAKLDEDELLFVMGHEMGHYVLGHVNQYVILGPLGIMSGLLFIQLVRRRVLRAAASRSGVSELGDVASLPLALFILMAGGLVASPLLLAHSRSLEREADRFGLELTRENRAAAEAFVALQEENLSVPDPSLFYRIFRSSHPPLGDRIRFCNEYRPWEKDEALVYGDRFREPSEDTPVISPD
jgi:Zn-dependent protease with chaperone function